MATLFGAAACCGVVVITAPPGPGLDPDSMSYLGAAESFVRHGSLRVPMATWDDPDSMSALRHFPPGFPLVVALPMAFGAHPVQAARAVIAGSAFATVALSVYLVSSVAGIGGGVLAGVALLASPSYAFDHWQVISEPLCLALLVVTLALMARGRAPWTYGLSAALAAAVRYAALSAIGAAVLWACGRGGPVRDRVRRAAVALLPGLVLNGLWAVHAAAGSGGVHGMEWQPGAGGIFGELGQTLMRWLAPSVLPWPVAALLAAAVATYGLWIVVGALRVPPPVQDAARGRASASALLRAALLLAACYAAEVFAARLLVYDNIPFDDRLLSPFAVLVELAVAAALGASWRARPKRGRVVVGALLFMWLASSAWATVQAVQDAVDGGWGYANDDWRGSQLGAWLREQGARSPLWSNDPAAVYFLTHRPSREVPARLAPDTLRVFGGVLRERQGLLVRFPYDYEPVASPDTLARRLDLPLLASFPEGVVWGARRPAP